MTQFGLVLLPGWPERSTKSHEIARTHIQFSFVCFRGSIYLAPPISQERAQPGRGSYVLLTAFVWKRAKRRGDARLAGE